MEDPNPVFGIFGQSGDLRQATVKAEPLKSRTPPVDERAGDNETMMAPVCTRGTWIANSFMRRSLMGHTTMTSVVGV